MLVFEHGDVLEARPEQLYSPWFFSRSFQGACLLAVGGWVALVELRTWRDSRMLDWDHWLWLILSLGLLLGGAHQLLVAERMLVDKRQRVVVLITQMLGNPLWSKRIPFGTIECLQLEEQPGRNIVHWSWYWNLYLTYHENDGSFQRRFLEFSNERQKLVSAAETIAESIGCPLRGTWRSEASPDG